SRSCRLRCFFFQAEDGIRDFHVTGVQTCALPILELGYRDGRGLGVLGRAGFDARARERDAASPVAVGGGIVLGGFRVDYAYRARSEERRVGKGGRSRESPEHARDSRSTADRSRAR